MDTDSAASLDIPIRDFIDTDIPVVRLGDPISLALERYKASPRQVVLLENEKGVLAGMITDNDLTKLVGIDSNGKVEQIATTSNLVAIKNDAQLWQLLKIMNGENPLEAKLDILPVVDDGDHPVGVVTRERLRASLASTLLQQEKTLNPNRA